MKTITRIVAVLMAVAMIAALMAACGEKNTLKDDRLYGTWKQTDEVDGNWTWVFNEDGTCSLKGETTGFDSKGTYTIEGDDFGKMRVKLDGWSEEKLFTYAVTEKALDMEEPHSSYYCIKQ